MLRIHELCILSISLCAGGDFLFYWRAMEKKQELRVAICGNAANIAACVKHSFKDTYDLKFCVTEEALELLYYTKLQPCESLKNISRI